jgi:hypothetical protein
MNDDAEFFDAVPVGPNERGESFGLTAVCYGRMAQCALRAMEYGHVEPVLIRKLHSGPGAELVLYGTTNAYTLRVSASHSPAAISLNYLPLDSTLGGPGCLLAQGYDQPQDWLALCDLMIWREGTAGSDELLEWQEICETLRASNDHWDWMT